jgi:hypothetical protein
MFIMVQMFFACTQSDDPAARPGGELQVSVTASGYASIESGAPETRATEAGYATSFANGDQIGVIAVQNNAVVQDNISYTYSSGAWAPSDAGKKAYVPFGTVAWIVYYPYSADMDGKKTEEEIFDAFNVPVDQGSQPEYAASDLMMWSGGMSAGATLNATLAHRLAMLEINLPAGAGNASVQVGAGGVISPWNISGTTWRCLVKPAAGAAVSGSHIAYATKIAWQQANVTLEAGKYTRLNVANGNIDTHSSIEGYTGNIEMLYADNTSVTIPASDFNWLHLGKTVKSITLNGKTHLIGRVIDAVNPISLKFDGSGNLLPRDAVDGFIPIGSYAEFQKISGSAQNKYRLEADLDLMDEEWAPIVISGQPYFTGEFDGAGKKISNLKIDKSGENDKGLFRANRGTIRNVHIVSGMIAGRDFIGGICGVNELSGQIISCANAATVWKDPTSSASGTGAIAAHNLGGAVIACYNTGTVSGYGPVGGIVGYMASPGAVIACYNTGTVLASGFLGSVVGFSAGGCTVAACYWKDGTVTNDTGIGNNDGSATVFTDYFNPGTSGAWGTGTGGENGWWKAGINYTNTLPKLWYE